MAVATGLSPRLRSRLARLDGAGRVAGVDLARGVAVLGMFGAHLLWTVPFTWQSPGSWTDLVNGRSSILFATLAGVALALVTGGASPLGPVRMRRARGRIAVRALCVWLIGIAMVLLDTPVLVILPAYAILFLLALPALRLSASTLLVVAGAIALAAPFLLFAVQGWSPQRQWWWQLADSAVGWHYPFPLWAGFVLAGLGIGRLRIDRPVVAALLAVGGVALAALGYGVLGRAAALVPADSALAFVLSAEPHASGAGEAIGSGGFAIAVLALCLLLCATPVRWLLLPLRAVGAMPLTAYVAQLVVWAALQPEPRQGEGELVAFRELDPFWPFAVLTVAGCTAWTLLVGRGPLEWAISWLSRQLVPDRLDR